MNTSAITKEPESLPYFSQFSSLFTKKKTPEHEVKKALLKLLETPDVEQLLAERQPIQDYNQTRRNRQVFNRFTSCLDELESAAQIHILDLHDLYKKKSQLFEKKAELDSRSQNASSNKVLSAPPTG